MTTIDAQLCWARLPLLMQATQLMYTVAGSSLRCAGKAGWLAGVREDPNEPCCVRSSGVPLPSSELRSDEEARAAEIIGR